MLCALGLAGTVLFDNQIMFLLVGNVIVLMGLGVFIRFLRRYRVPAQEGAPNN